MSYDTPIIITGAARSGTSLVAGIIHLCGAWGGKMRKPNVNNEKGMFENISIVQDVVKPFLRSIGADPMGQNPLPNMNKVVSATSAFINSWRIRVLDIIRSEGYSGHQKWFYKGAKNCLIWPIWHMTFPKAQWIIVRRKREDIVSSCLQTSFMRAYKDETGWMQWVLHHEQCFQEMKSAGLDIVEIWPDQIIKGNYHEIRTVVTKLGLPYNQDNVGSFVSPELWHYKE